MGSTWNKNTQQVHGRDMHRVLKKIFTKMKNAIFDKIQIIILLKYLFLYMKFRFKIMLLFFFIIIIFNFVIYS